MSEKGVFDFLTQEDKELLLNYKNKRVTIYEPCTPDNFVECLIGLREELGLLNINYIFNPFIDVDHEKLNSKAMVNLINATWSLLHHQKNATEKIEHLMEENHVLAQKNKDLNNLVSRLDKRINSKKSETQACVRSAQKMLDRSDEICEKLTECKARLLQITKQKEAMERNYKTEISRLQKENEKLLNKLQNKSGSFSPCTNICDSTILKLKEKEKKQHAVIGKLQTNNQDLLQEVIALKEDLLIGALNNSSIN